MPIYAIRIQGRVCESYSAIPWPTRRAPLSSGPRQRAQLNGLRLAHEDQALLEGVQHASCNQHEG